MSLKIDDFPVELWTKIGGHLNCQDRTNVSQVSRNARDGIADIANVILSSIEAYANANQIGSARASYLIKATANYALDKRIQLIFNEVRHCGAVDICQTPSDIVLSLHAIAKKQAEILFFIFKVLCSDPSNVWVIKFINSTFGSILQVDVTDETHILKLQQWCRENEDVLQALDSLQIYEFPADVILPHELVHFKKLKEISLHCRTQRFINVLHGLPHEIKKKNCHVVVEGLIIDNLVRQDYEYVQNLHSYNNSKSNISQDFFELFDPFFGYRSNPFVNFIGALIAPVLLIICCFTALVKLIYAESILKPTQEVLF